MTTTVKSLPYEKKFNIALKYVSGLVTPRAGLTGVYHAQDGKLIATDGLCLIRIEHGHDFETPCLIDKLGNHLLDSYPDVSRIIPSRYKIRLENVDLTTWIKTHEAGWDSVKEQTYTATRREKGQKIEAKHKDPSYPVMLEFVNGEIELQLKNGHVVIGHLPGPHVPNFKIKYNYKYMLKSLKALRQLGGKTCTIDFTSDRSPIKLFTDEALILISPLLIEG